jgi:hypothetical protein
MNVLRINSIYLNTLFVVSRHFKLNKRRVLVDIYIPARGSAASTTDIRSTPVMIKANLCILSQC